MTEYSTDGTRIHLRRRAHAARQGPGRRRARATEAAGTGGRPRGRTPGPRSGCAQRPGAGPGLCRPGGRPGRQYRARVEAACRRRRRRVCLHVEQLLCVGSHGHRPRGHSGGGRESRSGAGGRRRDDVARAVPRRQRQLLHRRELAEAHALHSRRARGRSARRKGRSFPRATRCSRARVATASRRGGSGSGADGFAGAARWLEPRRMRPASVHRAITGRDGAELRGPGHAIRGRARRPDRSSPHDRSRAADLRRRRARADRWRTEGGGQAACTDPGLCGIRRRSARFAAGRIHARWRRCWSAPG